MLKKILVISDNLPLASYFQSECARQGVDETAEVIYRYSSSNRSPSAMISLGALPVDLSDPAEVAGIIESYDLVFSIHCKQIFPYDLVTSVVCVNVHPGYNPYNRGWYPQAFSIMNKKPAGATIHLMDSEVDHGEIIDQARVDVLSSDTSLDVYEKIIMAEKALISKNLLALTGLDYSAEAPESEGNYNSIEDYRSLCRLDLDDIGTLREHMDLLRALTHGEFRNAFYLDEAGEKIFVRISFEKE